MPHTFRLLRLLLSLAIVTAAQTNRGGIREAFANTSPGDGKIGDRDDGLGEDVVPSMARDDWLGETADARMRWDLHCAAVAIEAFYGSNGDSYGGATVPILRSLGFRPTKGVTLTILDATDQHYRLKASAAGGSFKSWVFDSSNAKIVPGSR
jgi:hypothetical protein